MSQKNKLFLFLIVVFLTLFPYLYLSFYSYPSTDDFAYANHVIDAGFWQGQINTYKNWSGRYMATFLLSFNPVAQKWIWGFPLIPLILLMSLGGAVFYLFHNLLSAHLINKSSLPNKMFVWLVSTSFLSLFLAHLPTPVQAFYWLAGSVTYTFPMILVTVCLTWFYQLWRDGSLSKLKWISISVFSFIIVGSNETIMLQWTLTLLIVLFLLKKKNKSISLSVACALIFSLIGSLIVVLAPGNNIRSQHFPDAHRPFYAIFRTVGTSIDHFVQFLNLPLIFISLLLISVLLENQHQLRSFLPKLLPLKSLFFCWGLMMFSAFFPAMWAMGGNPPKRVDNTTYYWFLYFWFLILLTHVIKNPEFYYRWMQKYPLNIITKKQTLFTLVIISLMSTKNHRNAFLDLLKAEKFKNEWNQRQKQSEEISSSKNDKKSIVEFSPIKHKPHILYNEDLTEDPEYWNNSAWAKYFHLPGVRVINEPHPIE